MNMIRFENPQFLYFLALIPLLVLIFLLSEYFRKKRLHQFASSLMIKTLMPDTSAWRKWFKLVLFSLAFATLIVAMANPQTGSKLQEVKRKGIDLFIALDVSNSMLSEDILPNRLERSKQALLNLIDKLEGDRIGMIVFAGRAYVQLPITTDYYAARLFLSTINPGMIPTQGTAIGEAINLAMNSFDENNHNKAIIIISDGEDHEENAVKAAEKAAELGIHIYAIGMGLPDGSPIPLYNEFGKKTGFRKDRSGNTIVTRLNETILQQIALSGNGSYTRANNSRSGLEFIFDEINKIEKAEIEARVFTDYDNKFQIFLAITLLFLVIELLIASRKSKWENKFDIFNPKNSES
ncbi:MAG: VWA domain-containing protein [Bacteroidales bacterium]|nr:VWA domain-containing protein [Bacteroidales bacterium]